MPPYECTAKHSVEDVELIQIGLKERIWLLEVCGLSSSSSYAHGLEATIDLYNLHPPPLHGLHYRCELYNKLCA